MPSDNLDTITFKLADHDVDFVGRWLIAPCGDDSYSTDDRFPYRTAWGVALRATDSILVFRQDDVDGDDVGYR